MTQFWMSSLLPLLMSESMGLCRTFDSKFTANTGCKFHKSSSGSLGLWSCTRLSGQGKMQFVSPPFQHIRTQYPATSTSTYEHFGECCPAWTLLQILQFSQPRIFHLFATLLKHVETSLLALPSLIGCHVHVSIVVVFVVFCSSHLNPCHWFLAEKKAKCSTKPESTNKPLLGQWPGGAISAQDSTRIATICT